jgi:predicted RND superfamily exporter protein
MTALRLRIEHGFERYAGVVCRHRLATIVLMLLLAAVMIVHIPEITIDTSTEGFLHASDPAIIAYNAFRDQFGRDEVIVIALRPAAVFSLPFLTRLKALHEELEEKVPHVDEVTSLINARNTRGTGSDLIVEDLFEKWPRSEAELAVIRSRVMRNPMYQNLLLSDDGTFTTLIIRTQAYSQDSSGGEPDLLMAEETAGEPAPVYLTDRENSQAVLAARAITDRYRSEGVEVFIAGSPVVTHFLKNAMMRDMGRFMAMAIALVAVLLFIMFRRIAGVLLPLGIVLLSLASTLGLMAANETAIKVPTQILPSFLLAVGVGTSVHILAIFYHRLRNGDSREAAIAYALGHSGLAVIMTNLTTAAGLLSFATAEIAPIADIGIFAGIGVLLAFVYSLVLLPAVLGCLPARIGRSGEAGKNDLMGRCLHHIADFSTGHAGKILLAFLLLVITAGVFIAGIRFSHHPLGWFPPDNPIRIATETIDRHMRGSLNLEIVIDTGRENGLYAPELLARLDAAANHFERYEHQDVFVGKAWSLTTVLKEIHQALNENRPAFYAIPANRELIAQEFLLFENSGSDDLEDLVDSRFSMARLTLKVPFEDIVAFEDLLAECQRYFSAGFPAERITLTGMMGLLARTLINAIHSMAKSYAIALLVITLLMILLIGRIRIGLLSMIPNLTPILITMGVIGLFKLPMDLFTMMVASIAIGLAVDDTIHFMHNFRRYYEESGDPVQAVHATLQTSGRAMLVTTIVLSVGFFIYTFATMRNITNFGMLTGFTIIMALAADYLVAPALMVMVNRVHHPIKGG